MKWRWLAVLGLMALAGLSLTACAGKPLLYDVHADPALIRPDGSGIADLTKIHYALGRRASVTLAIVDAAGNTFTMRDAVLRAPDEYETRFDGSVASGEGPNRRVLPDGSYTIKIRATDEAGEQIEKTLPLTIVDADTSPLEIANLVIRPNRDRPDAEGEQSGPITITPNNDGDRDDANISYSLSKEAEVTVFATDAEGNFALLMPPTKQQGEAGLPAPWDGKENGGRLLPDGTYTIHVKAVDKAANVTEVTQEVLLENGGTPRMAITKVKFWPTIVPISGTLHVEITVKNVGDTVIKTKCPDPGTRYSLQQSYASFRDDKGTPLCFEEPGRWRVGVMWNNAPQPYPVRWGFSTKDESGQYQDLKPGDEVTVGGDIVIDAELPRTGTYFWAGIEQGGVGFLDTNKGQTAIRFDR